MIYSNLGIIFLAAGKSSRYGSNKLIEKLHGLPVFIHSILNMHSLCPEKNIVIVCHDDYLVLYQKIVKEIIPDRTFSFISGGLERFNSVYNGLKVLVKNQNVTFVAIHDTARPLADKNLLIKCLTSCKNNGNGVAARKISDTVKRTDHSNKVTETIDRTNLWSVETPQVFLFNEILNAYKRAISDKIQITDDAGAIEYIEKDVYLVENTKPNIKITYKTDLNNL